MRGEVSRQASRAVQTIEANEYEREVTVVTTPAGAFTAAGPATGPLVLLLHGYPQTRHTWRHQLPALGAAGYRAVAPDQRGYSAGVRPDPAKGLDAYAIDRLVQDVLDLADAAGGPGERFHLVGHDWGGHVSWVTAHRHPARIRSLTQLLEDGARRLRARLSEQGVPEAAVAEYLSVLGEPAALEAALAWYRAAGTLTAVEVGPVTVPTLYLWGDADATVGPSAARFTADFVTGPFQFEVLPGVGHFVTDQDPEAVTRGLLSHLARHR